MEYLYKNYIINSENVVYDYTSPKDIEWWNGDAELAYLAEIARIIKTNCPEVINVQFLESFYAPGSNRLHGVMDETIKNEIEYAIMELDFNQFVKLNNENWMNVYDSEA